MKIAVIILAAGTSERFSGQMPKQYQLLKGQPVLHYSLEAFEKTSITGNICIENICVVIHPSHQQLYHEMVFPHHTKPTIILGGESRQISVYNALKSFKNHPDAVIIHDAARPLITPSFIRELVHAFQGKSALIPLLPIADTLKEITQEGALKTHARDRYGRAQTPQIFNFSILYHLYKNLEENAILFSKTYTDDAQILEENGYPVSYIKGQETLLKITHQQDLKIIENMKECQDNHLMKQDDFLSAPFITTGQGFDVHAFEEGEGLILGGVNLPFSRKLKGHSDADVVLHALTDALLGALGQGDIGMYFPPTDPQWKDQSSSVFLQHALKLVNQEKAQINHVDITIIGEAPKISPYRLQIKNHLIEMLHLSFCQVNIKATTTEKLGFLGRKEGLAAMAIVTLSRASLKAKKCP